ncbi:hypothetical protein [Chryseobacterium gleum]|uniref:hypothetical protein n=1 Tax=Chryseobacterium gleum TaxID=250 RepID=UPI0028AEB056|nr:hypothetical protein [Chryseobacterium gleum]
MKKDFYLTRYALIIKRLESSPATYSQLKDYLLNSFILSSSCDNDNTKTWISKSFLCKTHVISNDYIDLNKDFKIINILYYNTLSLTSNSDKNKFEITIYEKVDRQMNLLMRKTIIKGNKEDAIDYLKRYNINYNNINDKDFQEQDFKKI